MPDPLLETPPDTLPGPILLYDGLCGLCHRTVAWVLARDRDEKLWFAPLQGLTAKRLRALHPEIPGELEGVVLVDGDRVLKRSRALFEAARYLRPPWSFLSVLRFLPTAFFDPAYRLVARVRYRALGRFDACTVPSVADRRRLLP
ncbi:MAG TPA: DCC1-like thiol-disulfide oxidoreductase family protein [Anaeromyxobacter sp.]|nr:DCC1-like thiol-disulfide oxidoreductase family protein [Anaeromyxobacter sp.]